MTPTLTLLKMAFKVKAKLILQYYGHFSIFIMEKFQTHTKVEQMVSQAPRTQQPPRLLNQASEPLHHRVLPTSLLPFIPASQSTPAALAFFLFS